MDSTVFHSSWATYDDWQHKLAQNPDGLVCTSVGYLLRVDKLRVVVAQSFNSFGHIADTMSIPTGCIKSIKTLAEPVTLFK